jgi:peptide/nickel transport system permease protein
VSTSYAHPEGTAPTQQPAAAQEAQQVSFFYRWPFFVFFVRRLAAMVLLMLGITAVAFVLTNLVPGDPAAANLGVQAAADPQAVKAFHERYGLDKPLPAQYGLYLWRLVHGDFGISITTQAPVSRDLEAFIPATIELGLLAILIGVIVGITLGVFAALRRNKLPDHVLRVVSLIGLSMPTFWIALVALYIFFFRLGWFPGSGRLDPGEATPPHVTGMYTVDALLAGEWGTFWSAFHHLLLPAIVLASFAIGLLTRYTRSAVLEVMGNDYIRAARAKGLSERMVVYRHILRAALPSVVTVIGLVFASVLTGAILVEHIFGYPGMGQYAYQSATTLDLPAIMATSMFVAFVYVVVNFIVDVLYGLIDPRVRFSA